MKIGSNLISNFRGAISEVKHYDRMLQVVWQVLTNQSVIFQSWVIVYDIVSLNMSLQPLGAGPKTA